MTKPEILKLFDTELAKYEGEVKGYELMLKKEEASNINEQIKQQNIAKWRNDLRRARYTLTTTKNRIAEFKRTWLPNL